MLSAAVVQVAVPAPLTGTLPHRAAAPSLKVTVPVGVPVAGATAVTVAVKVTLCPKLDGLTLEASAVVAFALVTI